MLKQVIIVVVLLVGLIAILNEIDPKRSEELQQYHKWAVSRVQASALGDPGVLLAAAREFASSSKVSISECDWKVSDIWGHSIAGLLGDAAGVTGFRVTCIASLTDPDHASPPLIDFTWNVRRLDGEVSDFQRYWEPEPE